MGGVVGLVVGLVVDGGGGGRGGGGSGSQSVLSAQGTSLLHAIMPAPVQFCGSKAPTSTQRHGGVSYASEEGRRSSSSFSLSSHSFSFSETHGVGALVGAFVARVGEGVGDRVGESVSFLFVGLGVGAVVGLNVGTFLQQKRVVGGDVDGVGGVGVGVGGDDP
jgi:hypothetical protein